MKLELAAATAFGLEAVARREIEALGYRILATENGRVVFAGDERAVVRANLWLRTADRIQIVLDEFMAEESEELFQRVRGMEWEKIIPMNGKFTVTCSTVKSKLASEPNNQKTVKKAIALRLSDFYSIDRLPEDGPEYVIKISLLKDRVLITLDTSGESLHKRGYRKHPVPAPVKETLAAAMIELTYWKKERILLDPCCGSGTIPIEAAMIARNIAPGISRHFAAEEWDMIDGEIWKQERKKAYEAIDYESDISIFGRDIDPEAVSAAVKNAEEAGVDDCIDFRRGDAAQMKIPELKDANGGIVITNPPYGERIGDERKIEKIYRGFGRFFRENPTWSLFMITSDKECEMKIMERKADRRRKLYNGRLEVCYYQFHNKERF